MDALLWVLLPVFVAAGSALLSYSIMQSKLEVAVARERAMLAEAHACVNTYKITMEERIRAAEEETRRKALNDFMQEFRVEERQYVRENKSASARRKTMVMQERLFFRNIPLSNWVEHELVMEETTGNTQDVAENYSIFSTRALGDEDKALAGRLLS
jgi:hypothetical protein